MAEKILTQLCSTLDSAKAKTSETKLTFYDVLNSIKSGQYKTKIEACRQKLAEGDNEGYRKAKEKLKAFCISARLEGRKVKELTGLTQIDIDKIAQDEIARLKLSAKEDPHIAFAFVSPSGNGLKIGLRIDPERYENSYASAIKYFKDTYSVEIDTHVKNSNALCFISYDPDIIIK
jgi:hypothetical protein